MVARVALLAAAPLLNVFDPAGPGLGFASPLASGSPDSIGGRVFATNGRGEAICRKQTKLAAIPNRRMMRRRLVPDDAVMAFAPLKSIPALLPVEGTTGVDTNFPGGG